MTLELSILAAALALVALAGLLAPAPRRHRPQAPAGRRALNARLRDTGPAHLAVPRPHVHAPRRRLGELLAVR